MIGSTAGARIERRPSSICAPGARAAGLARFTPRKFCYLSPAPRGPGLPHNRLPMRNGLKRVLRRLYGWPSLLLTLTCVFWAGNTVAGRLAVGQVTPMLLTLLRWVLV